ncbi:MAG TPA: hypothetical protein VIO60_02890 [Rectinemataceae bacterium]
MLDMESARSIYEAIRASSLDELKEDLFRYAVSYAQERSRWRLASSEERRDMDEHRSRVHTCFIDSCTILARNQQKTQEDSSWRGRLGTDRRTIGDLACWIQLFLALEAR